MSAPVAFLYGVLHTLGPGHGKAVVVSYFVGAGGSLKRGVIMGSQIAIIHVFSAVAFVFLLDLVVRQATGEAPSDYRLIRLISYGVIVVIGAIMLWQAVHNLILSRRSADSEHDHEHSTAHDHGHSGCAACAAAAASNTRSAGWLAAAVGVVPCTGALIVMLFGLANDLVVPAVLMVVAISVGMALAMSAIGVAAIWSRSLVERRIGSDQNGRARFERGARLAGASCVLIVGGGLFLATLSSPGASNISSAETTARVANAESNGHRQ